MDIQSERHPQALVVSLAGSFDALTADQVQSFIGAQLDEGQQHIVVELGQVEFMSSSGIRILVELIRKGRRMGGDLRLAAAQPGVKRTLELSGLTRILQVYSSVEEAVRSLDPPAP